MCGIAGQFNFLDGRPVERATLERMARSIIHRGPDDEGYFLSGSLGLAFRRLSIIDLGAGHQPMSDAEQSTWVVFNGEIYNFKSLRAELERCGHRFRTNSDTEVIVHGYKEWGHGILRRLKGMFGLAIWDETARRLIVARDATGIKPVYYRLTDRSIFFGSEIRAVLAGTQEKPAVDPAGVNLFLRYRYTPAPLTVFKGIRKLAPGEMVLVENGAAEVRRWYHFEPGALDPMPSDRLAGEQLLELYKQAMERHLISDVPVGLLLSGGMDSGLLLGLMSLFGKGWETYTVGYGSSFKDDELEDAADTARVFSARNSQVRLDRATFEAALPRIVQMLEEPVASSSIIPMYFVCQRARADVKVALIGQGPDELFGGYTRHLGVRYGHLWRGTPQPLRSAIAHIVRAMPRQEALKRAVSSLAITDKMRRYETVFSLVPGLPMNDLFRDGLLEAKAETDLMECWRDIVPVAEKLDEFNGFQLIELRSALPDELLMYGDKLSMAHGLEVRVPFLDLDVVEYVQRLAPRFKVRMGSRKWLHRRVCRDFLPPRILQRRKRGFAVNVVDDWFQDSVGGKMERDLLAPDARIYQFLRRDAVERLCAEHASGRNDNHKILFSLVVLEKWLHAHVNN